MQLINRHKSKMHLIGALGLFFSIVSCGSYQYVGNDDGIYGTSERNVYYQTEYPNDVVTSQNSGYYQNFFKEKSQELDFLSQDNVIFTDIDAYESDYETENDTLANEQISYGGWGQNNTDVSINIYTSRFFSNNWWFSPHYFRFNHGFFWHDPFRFHGFYSWNNPYRFYGFYNWYSPYRFHGFGFGNFHNNFHNRRGIAFNTGRRGVVNQNSFASRLNNRSLINSRNRSLINSRNSSTFRPRRATNSNVRANTNTVTRPRTTTRRNINQDRRLNPNTRARTNTRSVSPTRSSTRTRSVSPSRSSTRSSSPARSSVRGTNSSGSSSGNNSRRRGNL